MSEPRYRGESWIHQQARETLAAARESAEQRARVDAEAERRREAKAARVEPPPLAAEPPAPSVPSESPKRRTWRDLSPDEINRYALAESLRP